MANGTQSQPATGHSAAAATLEKQGEAKRALARSGVKTSGYGLPCSKCHLYYPADLDACPTCKHKERVSVAHTKLQARAPQPSETQAPEKVNLEQEREEFLRQFKSELLHAHADSAVSQNVACTSAEHRHGETARAEICHSCYERLQERIDALEAALHIELGDAAHIVYGAVWADPSDPAKTYQNAANALLTELCKRAGITPDFEPLPPVSE